jgi:hypothetical protein
LADFSVFRHFLAAGTAETLKNFKVVHLIPQIGQTSKAKLEIPPIARTG